MHSAWYGPRPHGAWPACAAQLGLSRRGARGARRSNARRRCSASWRRHGAGARVAAEEQRLTGAGTADGGTVGEAVRTAAGSARRRWRHGARGDCRAGAARRGRGCCRDARRAVPTAALSRGVGAAHGGRQVGPAFSDF
jgi:hypothetical protein